MDHKDIINGLTESSYLISMTPLESVVQLGFEAGMGPQHCVLDLCAATDRC